MIDPKRGLILIAVILAAALMSGCGALNQRLEVGTALVQGGNGDLAHGDVTLPVGEDGLSVADAAVIATSVQQTIDAVIGAADVDDEETATPTITAIAVPSSTSTPAQSPTITVPGVQYTAMAQTFTALVTTPTYPGTPPTVTPSPTGGTAAPTSEPGETEVPCLSMRLVFHVTYPPGSIVEPNTIFYKSWRVENTGTCAWTSGFSIVYHSGYQLGGQSPLPFEGTIYPGQRVTLTIPLYTNPQPGTYDSNWWLQSANGTKFGGGDNHDQPLPAMVVVPGEPEPVFVSPAVTSPPFYTPTP